MPRWTQDDLNKYQLRVGSGVLAPNPVPPPIAQCPIRDEPLAEVAGEKESAASFLVCITSQRRRLLDPDNLHVKATLDCLRYAGVLPDDTAKDVELQVRQRKVGPKEEESTLIEVFPRKP